MLIIVKSYILKHYITHNFIPFYDCYTYIIFVIKFNCDYYI